MRRFAGPLLFFAFVRVGAIFTLAFLFFGLIAAAIVRLVRRVRRA